jgi:hypothetical protein
MVMAPFFLHRTVPSLMLIVAMTLQPLMVWGCGSSLGISVEASLTDDASCCAGFGCCEGKDGSRGCCCRPQASPEPPTDGQPNVDMTCQCAVVDPPLSRDLPRAEVIRLLIQRISTDRVGGHQGSVDSLVWTVILTSDQFGTRADFSQRLFCVWRI